MGVKGGVKEGVKMGVKEDDSGYISRAAHHFESPGLGIES